MARRPAAKTRADGERRGSAAESERPRREGRRFLLEFSSVTLGVLLALALEQAATNWRERQRVDDLRASMHAEMADFAGIFHLRMRADKCIKAKLDAIEAHLDAGANGPVHRIGRPPYFFSSRSAFSSDATDQLARYLGAEKLRTYGEIYQGMAEFGAQASAEQKVWVAFQALEGDADALGPERRARLREAIAEARNAHLLLSAIAEQMLGNINNLGVSRTRQLDAVDLKTKDLCLPLSGEPGPAA